MRGVKRVWANPQILAAMRVCKVVRQCEKKCKERERRYTCDGETHSALWSARVGDGAEHNGHATAQYCICVFLGRPRLLHKELQGRATGHPVNMVSGNNNKLFYHPNNALSVIIVQDMKEQNNLQSLRRTKEIA